MQIKLRGNKITEPTKNEENKKYNIKVNISLLNESVERISTYCIRTNEIENLISEYCAEIEKLRKSLI